MENIEIKNVRLMNLHVSINQDDITYVPENVQAMLQVQYNFKQVDKKIISYRIVVGEDSNNGLYHVKCDYSFVTNNNDFLEEDIVKAAMDVLQPRIEEVLALITLEAGYLQVQNTQN